MPTPSDGKMIDAAVDAPDVYVPDARVCFGAGFGMTCLPAAPMGARQLSNTNSFDTGVDANCTHVMMVGGVTSCVLTGETVTMPAGETFRAIGTRPLVIVAATTVTIAGTVSVSSLRGVNAGAGTMSTGCTASAGENDAGGAGGGAGGSFMGRGGNGGTGDNNDNGGPSGSGSGATSLVELATAPTTIRGGCPGSDGGDGNLPHGAGGSGGGAIYIIAGGSISVSGAVLAAGMGGGNGDDNSAGGGGGSGGFIGFDGPVVTIAGAAAANGGGGGEGGGFNAGDPGDDGTADASRAAGGVFNQNGGDGGVGSGGAAMTGAAGGEGPGGGGGGGGGAGFIYVKGTLAGAGTISPTASIN